MGGLARKLNTGVLVGTAGLAATLVYLAGGRLRAPAGTVTVRRTLTVDAPVTEVFGFMARPENWPRFAGHLQAVTRVASDRYRWVGGPGGTLQWDTVLSRFGVNRVLAWRTVDDAPLRQVAELRFRTRPGGTTLDFELGYAPVPGGDPGAVERLLGRGPARALDDDVTRLQALLERADPTPGVAGWRS